MKNVIFALSLIIAPSPLFAQQMTAAQAQAYNAKRAFLMSRVGGGAAYLAQQPQAPQPADTAKVPKFHSVTDYIVNGDGHK